LPEAIETASAAAQASSSASFSTASSDVSIATNAGLTIVPLDETSTSALLSAAGSPTVSNSAPSGTTLPPSSISSTSQNVLIGVVTACVVAVCAILAVLAVAIAHRRRRPSLDKLPSAAAEPQPRQPPLTPSSSAPLLAPLVGSMSPPPPTRPSPAMPQLLPRVASASMAPVSQAFASATSYAMAPVVAPRPQAPPVPPLHSSSVSAGVAFSVLAAESPASTPVGLATTTSPLPPAVWATQADSAAVGSPVSPASPSRFATSGAWDGFSVRSDMTLVRATQASPADTLVPAAVTAAVLPSSS
ncbi:hypothetical protein HK405_009051, partial [Cladochytrium tenue]